MSRLLRCLLPAATLLLAGCFPSLYTDAPLGEPAAFKASEWDGLWICPDNGASELVRVRVEVPGAVGPATTKNWRECDVQRAGPWNEVGKVSRYGDWYFGSCEGRLTTGEPCAVWLVARREKETVFVFEADEVRIRKLFDEGKLPGRIEIRPSDRGVEERVVLHSLTPDHYKILFESGDGAFKLITLACIRIPADLDPCNEWK